MGNSTPCKIVTPKYFHLKLAYVITLGRLPNMQILVLIGTEIKKSRNQEWLIKYCSTDAGLRYSGNVFTTNNITNSVMTAQWR